LAKNNQNKKTLIKYFKNIYALEFMLFNFLFFIYKKLMKK